MTRTIVSLSVAKSGRRTSAALVLGALAALVACASVSPSRAQAPASHAVRIVVGVAAGSGADLTARMLAHALEAELGESVIVDNRPGGEGFIAARQVASALPDGRTLLFGLGSQFAINPAIFTSLPYDPKRDFAPIMMIARQPALIVVHPSLPVQTLGELADYTRAHPGTVSYGVGTSTFMLIAEAFKQRTGADMLHVPFKGSGPALNALLSGTVQVAVQAATAMLAHAESGRVRALAVSGERRLVALPDVPTLAESGQSDEVPVWTALFAPAGTPPGAIDTLHAAVMLAFARGSLRERWLAHAETLVLGTPEALAAAVARDTVRMKALAKSINLAPR